MLPWSQANLVFHSAGPVLGIGTMGFIQSNFGDKGNFELVICYTPEVPFLYHYYRDNDDHGAWLRSSTQEVPSQQNTSLIQSNLGINGNNFEVVTCDNTALSYFSRDNSNAAAMAKWIKPQPQPIL